MTRIFLQLIRRDMLVFWKEYPGKLFDILITYATWIAVFGYLMPLMGMKGDYGLFIMIGAIASFGIFDIVGKAGNLITDMKGDRTISYLLLLPIPSFVVFWAMASAWALQCLSIAIPLFVVGKLIFWTQFDLGNINWIYTIIALITVNLFFGFFSIWITSAMKNVQDLGRIYFRLINPLFISGCYFFTWQVAKQLSDVFAYIILIDPFSYVMEIMRAAIIGQKGYIFYWWSFLALWGFTIVCGWQGIRSLKKHLDCV